ncbi:hypothetical protein [Fictibacillus terranigra]|uniref:Uncharacterized protein n=1 Tax=Fictibacillus terranigra TaxID=3058424 RepID=A0ABT8E7S6_9BACL|nr:hypothetical protein [Fictibacillus sp. CENA-BCM004]MDN4073924.1 hypothetical protein [Fictibacillus sp. CENA-BCM004]
MKKEKEQVKIELIRKGGQTSIHFRDLPSVLQLLETAAEEGIAKKVEHFHDILAFRSSHAPVGETILSLNKVTNEILFFAPYPFKIMADSLNIAISYEH